MGVLAFAGCERGGGGGGGNVFEMLDDQKGERWTIRAFQSMAPDHERVVNALAEELKKVRGINARAVRVKHEAGASTLYYGSYKKTYDSKTQTGKFPPELTQDITLIRSLMLGTQSPFLLAQIELMNRKSVGPPELDLARAPGDLTLQVAVFYNEGEFQERELAAVQYAEALRQEGFEAWYHHFDTGRSVVTVGHFPSSAVVVRLDGTEEISQDVRDLIARKDEFRYTLMNGRVMKVRRPTGEFQPAPSCLVPIPRPGAAPGPEMP